MTNFRVVVASDTERDELVTELWYDDEMWGELIYEKNSFHIVIYPHRRGEPWKFDLSDFEQVLHKAKTEAMKNQTEAEVDHIYSDLL